MQEGGGEIQACGRGVWGPQQLKQDDRVLFSSPGSAWAMSGQKVCLPQGCSSASMGQGAWRAEGRAQSWGHAQCSGAPPPSQPREGSVRDL